MPTTFPALVQIFIDLILAAIPVVAGLALLVFFWGLVKFIAKGGDDKGEGKNLIVWGLIALFVMVSVWGILRFAYRDLGITGTFGIPLLPEN